MNAKDFRNVLLYMCNRWDELECNMIFNDPCVSLFNNEDYKYSIGWHIWNKWITACENHNGSLDCITYFILELDDRSLQKLINRSLEYYEK